MRKKFLGAFPMSPASLKEVGTKGTVSQVKDDVITYINHKPAGGTIRFFKSMQYYLRVDKTVSFEVNGHTFHFTQEYADLLDLPLLSDAEMNYVESLRQIMGFGPDVDEMRVKLEISQSPQELEEFFKQQSLLQPGLSWRNIYRLEESLEGKGILSRSDGVRYLDLEVFNRLAQYTTQVGNLMLYSDHHAQDGLAKFKACCALVLYKSSKND